MYDDNRPTNAELIRDDYEPPKLWFTLSETEDDAKEAQVQFYWNEHGEIDIFSIEDEAGTDIEDMLEPDTIYEIIQTCQNYLSTPKQNRLLWK